MITKQTQKKIMQHCCKLAKNGLGFTAPNPMVGALLADKNGNVVSEGWHHKYGDIHAEIDAINNAKLNGVSDFSDLNLFVSLEPCNHYGKQPPCTDAIIKAGIKNVFVGIEDPNPLVQGKGIAKLKDAGMQIKIGVAKKDCEKIIADYIYYVKTGMPYITLKVAQSIDGFIASNDGNPKYLTSEKSRKEVHFLRSFSAVLVGINTILADNPMLDNRLLDDNDVIKSAPSKIIILDSNLRTPPNSKIFSVKTKGNRTIFIAYNEKLDNTFELKKRKEMLEKKGAILIKSQTKNNKIHLPKLLSFLAEEHKISHILVEGGGEIFSSFINSNLCNELIIYIAPIILGEGVRAFPNVDKKILNEILNKYDKNYNMVGTDIVCRFVANV